VSATSPQSIVDLLAVARAGLLRLDPLRAVQAWEDGAVLVDIRPAAQRAEEGEVPGALLVERNVLEWRFDPASDARLPIASYDLHVLVLCSEGYTSSLAAAALQQVGVRRATDVIGGFRAWQASGLPTSGGKQARPSLSLVPDPSPAGDDVAPFDLSVDPDQRRAMVEGRELELTRLEFDLLAHLVAAPDRVHTRRVLLASLWDDRSGAGSRTVDVHVHRLRSKLGARAGQALQTVRGVGYRWSPRAVRATTSA
jgi:DNA-binding winged helix-turn-helix (wHTH) protein/rhodanese-related sulfurtransferase